MGEMIRMPIPGAELPADVRREMESMAAALQTMAAMLRATNETMAQLRRQVQLLEKVTPAQASEINRAVRERAAALCREYRAAGREKAVAAAIRKAMRATLGAQTVREVARCDYDVALQQARQWEDYKAMTAIRERGKDHE